MQLRRMFTVYVLTLALCLLFVASRTGPDEESPRDVEWFGGPADVIVPEGAEAPPTTLATPKGSRAVRALDLRDSDIPLTALLAYQRAADILAEVQPTCELPWTLLAAIGRVESNHGRYAGATLNTDGVSTPQMVGVALNGDGPVARIPDTDGGRLDQDTRWDRAVGPMQFIPSTWEVVGVDGDGDGVRSIHDIDDAALAAGVYLCAGSDDLREAAAMEAALFRYNDSDTYVALVMAYEEAYRNGDFTIETPGGGSVTAAAAVLAGPTLGATPLPRSARPSEKLRARIAADVRKAVAAATEAGATTPGISASPTPGTPPASATPSEARSGDSPAASSASGAGSSTPAPSDSGGDSSTATDGQTGSTTTTAPETSGGSSDAPSGSTSAPSEPVTSEPVAAPSDPTPSDPPADDPSPADPTPAVCETESPSADATETPSPQPSADATTDPVDPCKPTESPSAATESPGP